MKNPMRERLISQIINVGMLRRDVATDIADAILKDTFQLAGWAEPWEHPNEVYEDLAQFCTDYHSAAGDPIVELMPVFVGAPVFGLVTGVGGSPDEADEYEVSLHATEKEANAQFANDLAEIERERAG